MERGRPAASRAAGKFRPALAARSVAPARQTRAVKIALGLLGLTICSGLLIWVSLWLWPPQPARWLLLGAGYEENLAIPHNVFGWQGLNRLAELPPLRPAAWSWRPGGERPVPRRLLTSHGWDRELSSFPEKTVVFVFALHGGNDGRGPYLLANNADPYAEDFDAAGDGEQRLRLSRLLDRLKQLPASRNKVVIIDATQATAQWPLGMLTNDFAAALERLDEQVASVPNLVVLSSSAAGQRSWSSEEWQQTSFLHYLIEGLRGAAVHESGPLPLLDVYRYVSTEVERWARANRQALQTPVLLPRGAEGERRARGIELALIRVKDRDADGERPVPAGASDALSAMPPDLVADWKRAQQLEAKLPAPAVYAPHLWSRYLAVLLRLEQIERAGGRGTKSTTDLRAHLRRLELDIEQHRTIALPASGENSLAMPAVEGRTLSLPEPQRRTLVERFNDLWGAPGVKEAKKRWESIQGAASLDPAERSLVRLQMLRLLLDRAQAAPATNLETAHALLRDVLDPLTHPRPAEAQYLAMLDRDLARPLPVPRGSADRIARALRVRLLAERVTVGVGRKDGDYPYSEQILPWVRDAVRRGDQQRRLGEDLLFASEPHDWEESDAHFDAAEASFEEAIDRADSVRKALAIRERALPLLPYYTQWAACRRRPDEALISNLEDLWRRLHALIAALETPETGAAPAEIAAGADGVSSAFNSLEARFRAEVNHIGTVDTPAAWCDGDDALRVPFVDADRRADLWSDLRRMGSRLHSEVSRGRAKTGATPEEGRLSWAAELARRQGRMALAVLGKPWFNRRETDVPDAFEYVRHRLDTPELTQAGEEIGLQWRQRPAEVNRLIKRGLKEKIELARVDLRAAAALTRQLDAPACVHLDGDPLQLARGLQVRELLLEQAERAFADHWFAENTEAEPYYREAALADLVDAESLDPRPPPFRESVADRRARYTRPVALSLAGPARSIATSEQEIALHYQLQTGPDSLLPSGFPVVWIEAGPALEPRAPAAGQRVVRELGPRPADVIHCRLACPLLTKAEAEPPSLPRVEPTSLTVRGLYRGHRLARATALELHPQPEVVTKRHPLSPAAAIAVRATPELFQRYGESGGAVAIVLDCSGSMGPPEDAAPGAVTKFRTATQALDRLLMGIARGTQVSLWVFGANRGGNEPGEDAEKSIEQLQPPIIWDPRDDAGQRRRLIAEVEALRPWNQTPLVRTMLRAKNEDLALAPPGFKTMIVVTDGVDNRFAHDDEFNKARKTIPDVLREQFFDAGIEINLIGFGLEQADKKEIRKQFQVIEELPTPGKISGVDQSAALAATLERALKRRLRFWVERSGRTPVEGSEQGLAISRFGANDQWFAPVAPGGYDVRVPLAEPLLQPVTVAAGDRLLLSLVENPGGVEFERTFYTDETPPVFGPIVRRDWRASAVQNQIVGGRVLHLLVTLEKRFERDEPTIQLVKPREIWIELSTRSGTGSAPPFALRWGYHAALPAPAWMLEVPEWPRNPGTATPARPVVRIWWDPQHAAEPAGILARGIDFNVDAAPVGDSGPEGGRTIRLKTTAIVLESVRIEEHLVETGTRGDVQSPPRDLRTCLVVRVGHEPDHPVWVRPRGLTPDGSEHRFYNAAGKYTALFWTVNADQARQFLTHLEVIELNDFKQECERQRFVVELDGLHAPEPGSLPPLDIPAVPAPLLTPLPRAGLPSALPEKP